MTEDASSRYADFDLWSTGDMVDAIYEGQLAALTSVRAVLPAIAGAVDAAAERLGDTGRLVYAGAGTSGRLAVQDGAELTPTFGWPRERTIYCMAGGLQALLESAEGAEDSVDDGIDQIQAQNIGPADVVIAVAASGRTPFTLGALREARRRGALTIGVAMNPNTPVLKEAEHPVLALTGSELVAGSTRMKAGTAQKVILNMFSTALMVRLGRIYKGYMVDMIVSNNKLQKRAVSIVADIADCSADAAGAALESAHNNIKQAVLIAMGHSPSDSAALLAAHGGNLRDVLAEQAREAGE